MRTADAVRAALGATLLVWPDLPTRLLRTDPSTGSHAATRILGARWLGQVALATLVGRHGPEARRRMATGDAVVEAVHAASMVLLLGARPRWARPAAASATVAAALAVADLRRVRRRPVGTS